MKSLYLFTLSLFFVIYGSAGVPNHRESRVSPSSSSSSSSSSALSSTRTKQLSGITELSGSDEDSRIGGTVNSAETVMDIQKNLQTSSTKIKATTISSTTSAGGGGGATADGVVAALPETKKITNLKNSDDTNGVKETRESLGKIRPQLKITTNYTGGSETGVKLPEGASAALAKPTKYHYYPHNQHIYLLPECAVQQVCNAVYVRLNFTQPLCACPGRYRDPCSASLDSDDHHTTELVTDPRTKALTLVKTCEPVADMRECRAPKDWSLLALQNVRTGKSHYLVICRCPDTNILEGPMSHDQPMYASVPGIRVYGMMCVQGNRRGRPLRYTRSLLDLVERERDSKPLFPWHKVPELMKMAKL